MITSTTVGHDGLIFDVTLAGSADGVPVVLLHGFPQTSRSWNAVFEQLEGSGLRLVAPDQRGYSPGARPSAVEDYTMDVLVADVMATAASLGHERFHLVGHDWGASVAWSLAAHHPERVLSLTALSVPHLAAFGAALRDDPEQQRRSAYISDFRRRGQAEESLLADDAARLRALFGEGVSPVEVAAYVELMRDGALTPALSWYRAMGRELQQTPPVRVPTTFVWGVDDLATAPAAALACGEHVEADYRFVRLPGVGHWLPDEVPDLVAGEILARSTISGRARADDARARDR